MLAAPCRPARGLITFIQLSFLLPRVRWLRVPRARRCFVFRAPFRMHSDRRIVDILLHMLRESSVSCLNPDLKDFKD